MIKEEDEDESRTLNLGGPSGSHLGITNLEINNSKSEVARNRPLQANTSLEDAKGAFQKPTIAVPAAFENNDYLLMGQQGRQSSQKKVSRNFRNTLSKSSSGKNNDGRSAKLASASDKSTSVEFLYSRAAKVAPPSQEQASRPKLISPKMTRSSIHQKASLKGILNTQNQTFTEFEAKKSVEFNDKSTEIFNYKNRSIKSSV